MTDFLPRAGGPVTPSAAMVSADQISLIGNGTADDPVHSIGDGSSTLGEFVTDLPFTPVRGTPVVAFDREPAVGQASFRPASGASDGEPSAVGLIVDVVSTDGVPVVRVRMRGTVQLVASDWLLVAGTPGLTPGASYYLTAGNGALGTTPLAGSGQFVAQVGTAINTSTLALTTPVVATENP